MSNDMKAALWRIILNHIQRDKHGSDQTHERMLLYKFRWLAWIEAGGADPFPRPSPAATYPFLWSLYHKIIAEIANHRHDLPVTGH